MVWFKITIAIVSLLLTTSIALAGLGLSASQGVQSQGILLYRSWMGDNFDLFVMDVQRGLPVNLTRSSSNEVAPGWSPDGEQIVYVSDDAAQDNIYFMRLETMQITRLPSNAHVIRSPMLSPDGEQIAYISVNSNAGDLLVSHVDGSDVRKLSFFGTSNDIIGWVDDHYLAFASRDLNSQRLYLTHIHQHDIEEIEREMVDELFRQGSPDGRYQVTANYHSGQRDLLVSSEAAHYAIVRHIEHDWSPDGRFLAFISDREGNPELYILDTDGSDLRRLTYTPGDESTISWKPEKD